MIRLTRYLRPPQVKLELETTTPAEVPDGWSRDRFVWSVKDRVISELMPLLDSSGKIVNSRKLLVDLTNRERKASTAIGGGIAIPHVRTMQAREFAVCFARSTPGVEFGALDDQPVHFFFAVVAPPYDDRLYLEVYREIGQLLSSEATREMLARARTVHEVIKIVADITG